MITGLPGSSKIVCINVVKSDLFIFYDEECNEVFKDSDEVSFDIIHLKKNVKLETTSGFSFGRYMNEPYPHFLINSRIDYPIQEDYIPKLLNSGKIQSVLVENVKEFKSFYSYFKIMVGKDGSIIFDGSNGFGVRFAIGYLDCEIDFEAPRGPFRGLLKFIGSSKANFEILKTIPPDFLIKHEYYTTYAAFDRVFD